MQTGCHGYQKCLFHGILYFHQPATHGCIAIVLSFTPRHGLMDEGQAVVPVTGEDIVRGRGICRTGGIFFEIREIIP